MQTLKLLRKQNHLTQQEVADRLQITRSSYSKYENGIHQPNPALLQKFAKLYSVSVDYLLNPSTAFQPETASLKPLDKISDQEYKLIKKYRELDKRGQSTVKDIIDREYNYVKNRCE